MKTNHSSEKGQILILLVLVIVGLLGFTALAIDGGMIFADRRYTQSAADASSLAGAGAAADEVQKFGITFGKWDCDSPELNSIAYNAAINAAITSADVNDYDILVDTALGTTGHDHGVKYSCFEGENIESDYIDVEVMLSRVTNTSFVHMFTGGVMRNTVYSKTRVRPQLKAGMGAAIVGLGLECDKQDGGGVHFDSGSLIAELTGGGVYSNDCVTAKSGADVQISGGSVTCHEGTDCEITSPPPTIDDGFHPMTEQELIPNLGDQCDGLPDFGASDGGPIDPDTLEGEISHGNYTTWTFHDPVHLLPGLYCVTGTVRMEAGGEVYGDGVTIYYTGSDLTINGHAESGLRAPNAENVPVGVTPIPVENRAVEDVLLYVPLNVSAVIKINGTSNNTFSGTMFAPSSFYHITGTSDVTNPTMMDVSIIGKTVWISGDSALRLHYDEDNDAGWPAYLQVQK